MGQIVSVADFIGEQSIATDVYTSGDLQTAIDTFELELLYNMLGVELCTLFLDDLDVEGVPTSQIYLDLYEAWWKDINYTLTQSKGIKDMIVKYIFFFFVRKQGQDNSIQGNVQNEGTINYDSKMSYMSLTLQYNDSIKTMKAIQSYIEANKDVYPTYKGVYIQYLAGV